MLTISFPSHSPLRQALILVFVLLIARVIFSTLLPITGDEAYFVLWGRFPDYGYYDHPPMVGWWLSALLFISDNTTWLRLPSIVLPAFLGGVALFTFRHWGQDRALLAALFIVFAPANSWNILITTDTPLVFFGVLSAFAFIQAFTTERFSWYFICSLLFSGAVLSKYFAALLGIAFAIATLLAPTKRRFAGLILIGALMAPALIFMGWWNSENCWPNILFNLVNRNSRAGFHWQQPATYFLMLTYTLGFLPILYGFRCVQYLLPMHGSSEDRLYWALSWTPLILFALLSLSKPIGLHWVLTFIPLTLLGLLRILTLEQAQKSLRLLFLLGGLQLTVLCIVTALPLSLWKSNPLYPEIVWTFKTPELAEAAGMRDPNRHWFTDGYTYSAELSYGRDRLLGRNTPFGQAHVGVFGLGSHYARQDDRLTDFSKLDGQGFAILLRSPPKNEAFSPYFSTFSITPIPLYGTTFYRVLGDGFKFSVYRDEVLRSVRERFYQFPRWLPDCGCFFEQRYFSEKNRAER